MNLSGQERKKLTDALMNAFPNKSSLEQMLFFELNKKLDVIAGGDNLGGVIFKLLEIAEAQNWIEELISAARNSNPRNSSLKAIAEELLPNHDPEPDPNIYLDTNIYIERPPIEEKCLKAILQPGALIRIKAPQKMGKTLLLEKLLDHARQKGYQIAKLDLKLANKSILTDLKTFLQWLCVDVSDILDRSPNLDEYWQDSLGLNTSCTRYFQRYLLAKVDPRNKLSHRFTNITSTSKTAGGVALPGDADGGTIY